MWCSSVATTEMGLLLRQAKEQGLKTRFVGAEGAFNQGLIEIAALRGRA